MSTSLTRTDTVLKKLFYILLILFFLSFTVNIVYTYGHIRRREILNRPPVPVPPMLPIRENSIVFVGNSITANFPLNDLMPGHNLVNRGVPRNTTQDVLYRIDSIVKYKPKAIFLLEGVNDIQLYLPLSTTLDNCTKIMDHIGSIPLYVQAVLPTCYERGILNERINTLNDTLLKICIARHIAFLPINKAFMKNGQLDPVYTTDGIHLSEAGNKLWAKQVEPIIERLR